MRKLVFDGRSGASGDMILAALLEAGADRSVLAPVEDALSIEFERIETEIGGITASTVTVVSGERTSDGKYWDGDEDTLTSQKENQSSARDDPTGLVTSGPGSEGLEIDPVSMVKSMSLAEPVEDDSLAIIELLMSVESNGDQPQTDSSISAKQDVIATIGTVIGTALLINELDVDRVVTTPVATGRGKVRNGEVSYSVPRPSVVELAERADWAIQGELVESELLTPTAAGILAHFAEGVSTLPHIKLTASGYGARTSEFENTSNLIRALIGREAVPQGTEQIEIVETHVDDVTPEVLANLQSSLLDMGARDVVILPVTMKKSRPGHLVKVLVDPGNVGDITRELMEETGTRGIRTMTATHRFMTNEWVERAEVILQENTFEIPVKIAATADGTILDTSAEYGEAANVAEATETPVREIIQQAERRIRSELDG